jgi:small subunit ribosomal protein S7
MPRRSAAQIRPIEPDARHRNRLVQQLINKVMTDGKKSLAERLVYDSLAIVGERSGEDPVETLEGAIKSLTPVLEVRSRRVGGATYQVPVEVPARRARTLAVRWLVQFASTRWPSVSPARSSTPTSSRAAPGSGRTTFTAWPRPTRLSPTTAGSRPASSLI